MSQEKFVKITNQSFRDAGGLEVFPDLEIQEIIFTEGTGHCDEQGHVAASRKANENLTSKAIQLGYTHIFKATYEFKTYGHPNNDNFTCYVMGTGYAPRTIKSK